MRASSWWLPPSNTISGPRLLAVHPGCQARGDRPAPERRRGRPEVGHPCPGRSPAVPPAPHRWLRDRALRSPPDGPSPPALRGDPAGHPLPRDGSRLARKPPGPRGALPPPRRHRPGGRDPGRACPSGAPPPQKERAPSSRRPDGRSRRRALAPGSPAAHVGCGWQTSCRPGVVREGAQRLQDLYLRVRVEVPERLSAEQGGLARPEAALGAHQPQPRSRVIGRRSWLPPLALSPPPTAGRHRCGRCRSHLTGRRRHPG